VLVTDDVVSRHAACGNADEVGRTLARYGAAGLDEIVLAGIADAAMLQRLLAVCRATGP
jgi:5,10-methylenetetrahydromethanopterin reductase